MSKHDPADFKELPTTERLIDNFEGDDCYDIEMYVNGKTFPKMKDDDVPIECITFEYTQGPTVVFQMMDDQQLKKKNQQNTGHK